MSPNTQNTVTAIQFHNANFDAIEAFVGGDAEFRNGKLLVASPNGPLWVREGEWIVKDGDGHFTTCYSIEYAEAMGFSIRGSADAIEDTKA